MRVIKPPALFELNALVDLRHIHRKKDALICTEARFACPVDIPHLILRPLIQTRSNLAPSVVASFVSKTSRAQPAATSAA